MRGTAVLGTEPVPLGGLHRGIGSVPDVIGAVRHRVTLARELRRPERVNHVYRRELEVHCSSSRKINLVRRDDAVLRIPEFPPPLVTDDFDLQCACCYTCLRL